MRLRRIEAIRYGGLRDVTLDGLGDGLSLVCGPNEAGKSTMMSLVRHVLYGFPTARSTDRGYHVETGGREGTLVFVDDEGEWAVRRVEGAHGGAVSVESLRGPEATDLLGRLTAGVDQDTYRIALGFGADDLAEAASLEGELSKLVAAALGLSVSPDAVLAALDDEASDLYDPRRRKTVIQETVSRLTEVRTAIDAIRRDTDALIGERDRLGEIECELNRLNERRAELSVRSRALATAEDRLGEAASVTEERGVLIAGLESTAEDDRARLAQLVSDEKVLELASGIEALRDGLSGFEKVLEAMDAAKDAERASLSEAQQQLDAESWTAEQVRSVDAGTEARAALATFEAELRALASDVAAARRLADLAWPGAGAAPRQLWPVAAMALLGAGGLVAGVGLRQWVLAVFGAVAITVAVAAIVAMLWRRRLGQTGSAVPAGLSQAEAAYAARESEWHEWLARSGIPARTQDPAAVRAAVEGIAEISGLLRAADSARGEVARAAAEAEAFRVRAAAVLSALEGANAEPAVSDVKARVRAAVDRLEAARAASQERAVMKAGLREGERALEQARNDVGSALRRAAEAVEAAGLPADSDAAAVALEAERVSADLAACDDERTGLADERSRIQTLIDEAAKEDAASALTLESARLAEKAAADAERHVVLRVAARILEQAQLSYLERHHPGVIGAAEKAFAQMTAGRHSAIRLPLGGGEITVVTADGHVKRVPELSKGTADQLYLSLRFGLLEGLGGSGSGLPVLMDDVLVHFDDSRVAGAAEAVADLAKRRQVVVFSCRRETVDAYRKADKGLTLIEM